MSQTDDQQIRALIDAWGEASDAGDLAAQLNLMTEDVAFLTPGHPPMRREEFAAAFRAMIESVTLECRSNVQEITVSGDLAVCWNLLEGTQYARGMNDNERPIDCTRCCCFTALRPGEQF
jgi:uncharacterized protein (TIGR02246 family)